MEVAVDQFEQGTAGTQIYSTNFDIENKSAIPIKLSVTSTAELGENTMLTEKKSDAKANTAKSGEAWLAVAAQTDAGKFGTGTQDIKDVDEASVGVKTFDQNGTNAIAAQTFYLEKASTAYAILLTADRDEALEELGYTEFIELTDVTPASPTDVLIQALVNDQGLEVYVDKITGSAAQGDALEKLEWDATANSGAGAWDNGYTFANTHKFYTMAGVSTSEDSLDSNTVYAYADGTAGATNGKASFRYTGNLSSAQENWSNEDLSKITIKYDIVGLPETTYTAAVTSDIKYGYYTKAAEGVTTGTVALENKIPVLTVKDLKTDEYKGLKAVVDGVTMAANDWGTWTWPEDDTKDKKLTFSDDIVTWLKGKDVTNHKVKFMIEKNDGTWVSTYYEFK